MYGDDLCPRQIQSLAGGLQLAGVEGQTDGKLCSSGDLAELTAWKYVWYKIINPVHGYSILPYNT